MAFGRNFCCMTSWPRHEQVFPLPIGPIGCCMTWPRHEHFFHFSSDRLAAPRYAPCSADFVFVLATRDIRAAGCSASIRSAIARSCSIRVVPSLKWIHSYQSGFRASGERRKFPFRSQGRATKATLAREKVAAHRVSQLESESARVSKRRARGMPGDGS